MSLRLADDPAWNQAVIKAYDLSQAVVETEEARITLFSPKKGGSGSYFSSAPYLSDGGVSAGVPKLSQTTVSALRSLQRDSGAEYVLVRSIENLFEEAGREVLIDTDYFTFRFDLTPGSDRIWKEKIRAKTRNQVRAGLKRGIDVKTGRDELLPDFYRVMSRCFRDLGTPIYSRGFFRQILECFGDRAALMVLYSDRSEPVSAAVLIISGETLYHPYAATIRQFLPLSVNNALYWKIIEFGCERNLEFFDMGRSSRHQGTYRYKTGWNAEPVQLHYSYFLAEGASPPDFGSRRMRLASEAWKRLPLFLTNALGPRLIRNVL